MAAKTEMTSRLDWKAAVLAGLIAGVLFMMLEMVLVQISGQGGMWGPPRMIAAMVLGQDVLPPPASFELGILLTAMTVHFPLSVVYAFILAWILARWSPGPVGSAVAGTVFGLAIYIINFHGFTALFPWFADARGVIAIFSHAMFGLVLGAAYYRIYRRRHPV
ncbi:MAG: hypothetical protein K0S99_50 [Thermomicrobiales bacterium]|jgi:hypothetical protein|nr:hypothetical protein [Thermomicrobiales bacterium]